MVKPEEHWIGQEGTTVVCTAVRCAASSALVKIVGGRETTAECTVCARFAVGSVFCLPRRLVWRGGLWVGGEEEEEWCDGSVGSVVAGVRRVG